MSETIVEWQRKMAETPEECLRPCPARMFHAEQKVSGITKFEVSNSAEKPPANER
jgi:hypothetical protein